MRTTLSLDDDLVPRVKTYAVSRDITVGKAVSELVRRGLQAPLRTRMVNGFHVVELPSGSPMVTSEHVQEA
ncbi:MAG TPA: antitoxin [Candidatus Dormibacteraeota bacterium]|nr:antitoxin [Candidatus Dormibacteraeota bacterium]